MGVADRAGGAGASGGIGVGELAQAWIQAASVPSASSSLSPPRCSWRRRSSTRALRQAATRSPPRSCWRRRSLGSPTSSPAPCSPDSVHHQGTALLFRVRDPKLKVSVPVRYTGIVPDPFAEGRGVLVTVREQGVAVDRRAELADDQVPVEVPGSELVLMARDMALTGRALLILGLAVAVYGACASLYGVRTGRREWVDSRPALGVRARGPDDARVRDPRGRVPALGLLVQRRRGPLVDDHADVLQDDRAVVLAGGLAAAVGVAAVAVVEPRAVPDATARCARSCPTRPRSCSASARSSCR